MKNVKYITLDDGTESYWCLTTGFEYTLFTIDERLKSRKSYNCIRHIDNDKENFSLKIIELKMHGMVLFVHYYMYYSILIDYFLNNSLQ